jgi:hypothetical protein
VWWATDSDHDKVLAFSLVCPAAQPELASGTELTPQFFSTILLCSFSVIFVSSMFPGSYCGERLWFYALSSMQTRKTNLELQVCKTALVIIEYYSVDT